MQKRARRRAALEEMWDIVISRVRPGSALCSLDASESFSNSMLAVVLCASASLQPATAGVQTRRALLGNAIAAASFSAAPAFALEQLMVDPNSLKKADIGLLDEIPPKAKQAYLQYLPQLQLDADFYLFELKDWLNNPGRWDRIGELTASSDIGSAASVSRLEREFVTPMKILALAFPPDLGGEDMQSALDKFQQSMFQLSRQARRGATTGNVAGPSAKDVAEVYTTWEAGRQALNSFFFALNESTGTQRLVTIPAAGDEKAYPRSKLLYTQLLKDAAICRNRGGYLTLMTPDCL